MHAAAISPRGGVAPETTRFRGQSIIEYVLIAAIIGLVIVFAGPQVSGAIRNQFNLVGNTVDSETMQYRIIGINHDDLAGGSGKAGLTFLTTSTNIKSRMNAKSDNTGGWEKSELRQKMNSGEVWNLLPSDFQSKVKVVKKLTNNVGCGHEQNENTAAVTATSDKLFLLSYSEIVATPYSGWSNYLWIGNEGTQYEAFQGKVTNNYSGNSCLGIGNHWWERSVNPNRSYYVLNVGTNGDPSAGRVAAGSYCVCPAFCF